MKALNINLNLNANFPSPDDREKLQDILNRITTKSNELDSMTWFLTGTRLDFGVLERLQNQYPNWWKNERIDLIWLAKLLFLESINRNHKKTQLKTDFDAIIKTFFYLAENDTVSIQKQFLDQYIGFLMMHTLESERLVKRLTPNGYITVARYLISFREWPLILALFGLKNLALEGIFSYKIIDLAVKKAIEIESGGELCFSDWREGGSFNHLTLDYGRYYVDHCISFFDKNIGLALALQQTMDELSNIVEMLGYSTSMGNMADINKLVKKFLISCDFSALPVSITVKRKPGFEELFQAVLQNFTTNLQQIRALEALHSDKEVNGLAKKAGFKTLDDYNKDWIKQLIDIRGPSLIPWLAPVMSPKGDSEYNCFKSIVGSSMNLEALNRTIDSAYERLLENVSAEPPSASFYKSMEYFSDVKHGKSGKSISMLGRFLNNVKNSGIVKFVALTGWRESEFGFSLSDIEIAPNYDILDQYAHPVHYAVHWIVPKTNGNTKLHREITRSSYLCAYQLSLLVRAKADDPCLYSTTISNKVPKESGKSIQKKLPALWSHFVGLYEPFLQLDLLEELDVLKCKTSLDKVEASRFSKLSKRAIHEQWNNLKSDPLLVEARRRARKEHDRVSYFMTWNKPENWLWEYRTGNLQPSIQTMLDNYLSKETRAIISALQSEQEVTATLRRGISNELIGDCLYPTPHAFRHMWAEAVYRRFDGDAGWMIRSQFKHITQSMWLAYIRNKDNRRQHDLVKRDVISSLLANYLRKDGKGYAGAMDKLLRRLIINTKIVTVEQLSTAIDQYGIMEIEDIKANPWGYCLLRRRNQAHAKCADGGVPQRHNASPAFCLGCTHNITQQSSIPGIVIGISNDLKVLNRPQVPESFRRIAYITVSNALKQLRKLGANKDTLNEIEASLKAGAEKRLS